MYLPKLFQSHDSELLKTIIKENAFASLVVYKERILSTKAMMLLNDNDRENLFIETHIGRANPLAQKIKEGDEVLCDFLGAHTYISSSWYDHINVSTWNYEQVQIYGTVQFMNNDELYQHLRKLTNHYEQYQQCPMTIERIGKEMVEQEMRGALGIKVIPNEINIKQKLSQNRDDENYNRIIHQLNQSKCPMDNRIAQKMENLKKGKV